MILALFIALLILWLLGYIALPALVIPTISLFSINGHIVTLFDLLIFLVLLIITSALPSPFREVLFVVIVVWVLALLGIIAIVGLPNIILIAVIAGLIVYLLQGNRVIP